MSQMGGPWAYEIPRFSFPERALFQLDARAYFGVVSVVYFKHLKGISRNVNIISLVTHRNDFMINFSQMFRFCWSGFYPFGNQTFVHCFLR